jgi:hypothetical protein
LFAAFAAYGAAELGAHDPEKWAPVVGPDHARMNRMIPKSGHRFSDQIMRE